MAVSCFKVKRERILQTMCLMKDASRTTYPMAATQLQLQSTPMLTKVHTCPVSASRSYSLARASNDANVSCEIHSCLAFRLQRRRTALLVKGHAYPTRRQSERHTYSLQHRRMPILAMKSTFIHSALPSPLTGYSIKARQCQRSVPPPSAWRH